MEAKALISFKKNDIFEIAMPSCSVKLSIDKKTPEHEPSGPNSLELFLASLGGCIGVYAKSYLRRHSLEFKKLDIKVSAELSQDSPRRLINITVEVLVDNDLKEHKERFIRFINNCPVHHTIVHTGHIEIKVSQAQ